MQTENCLSLATILTSHKNNQNGRCVHNTNNQNSRCTKLKHFGVLATRVRTGECGINNLENPEREFSLELGQNSKLLLKTPNPILTNSNRKSQQ
jgi:hypothetical protein